VHIDRLTRYHGTVPKAWKPVFVREEEMTSEMSVNGKEICNSTEVDEAMHAKNYASELDTDMSAVVDASDNIRESEANVSDNICDSAGNSDMEGDLINLTDRIVELVDVDAGDQLQTDIFDNGEYFDMSNLTDNSGIDLDMDELPNRSGPALGRAREALAKASGIPGNQLHYNQLESFGVDERHQRG